VWLSVALPPDLPANWDPAFVDGGDGRLYAMDARHPFVFTPGEVVPLPAPGGGGSAPLPDTAADAPSTIPMAVLSGMLMVGAVSVWSVAVRRRGRAIG